MPNCCSAEPMAVPTSAFPIQVSPPAWDDDGDDDDGGDDDDDDDGDE